MNFNITGAWNSLGYGQVTKNIIMTSLKMGHEVALFPIGVQPEIEQQSEIPIIQYCIAKQDTYQKLSPSIRIWHEFDLAQHIGNGLHVGFPIFELNRFIPRSFHHLNQQDMLFVCSKWAAGILESNGITVPAKVIPLGVDTNIFKPGPDIRPTGSGFDKPYTFITVGKFSLNKGHDILIDAFNAAFDEKDYVQLNLMTFNPFLEQEQLADKKQFWVNKLSSSKLANKIKILERVRTQEEVAQRMNEADCGVFPSRGEGWNLELLECMACNKPVIATNYSGHTEFINEKNCSLIEITALEDAFDGIWFNGQGQWASLDEAQFEQLVTHMRNMYNNHICVNPEGLKTASKFNWQNTVQSIVSSFN